MSAVVGDVPARLRRGGGDVGQCEQFAGDLGRWNPTPAVAGKCVAARGIGDGGGDRR